MWTCQYIIGMIVHNHWYNCSVALWRLSSLFHNSVTPVVVWLTHRLSESWSRWDWEEEPRRQLQWRLKSSWDSLPSLLCGHELYVQMCVASIYELLTCVWPQCQHPLPCICVEACNSLLLVLLKVQRCHILFSASLPFKPLIFTPCWPASDTSTIMYSLLTCIAYNDATHRLIYTVTYISCLKINIHFFIAGNIWKLRRVLGPHWGKNNLRFPFREVVILWELSRNFKRKKIIILWG